MIMEPTLGDIIGMAVASEAERLCLQAERDELEANVHAARALCRRVGPMMGVTEGEAWNALTYVPDNLLSLLHSPQGWAALAGVIAYDLGVPAPSYLPTVH